VAPLNLVYNLLGTISHDATAHAASFNGEGKPMKSLHIAIAVTALALAVVREGHALDGAASGQGGPVVEQGVTPIESSTTWRTALTLEIASSEGSITGVLENVSGDTNYAKFSNSSPDTYRVYFTITDGDTVVQDKTSIEVQGNSSNSKGPYHCSSSATINITKTEKI